MKFFKQFGITNINYNNENEAAGNTYTTRDGILEPTPLIFNDNPFNKNIKSAKNIFEIGFGVGRNVKWIMENTTANYYGVEPNEFMFNSFWKFNDEQYKDRINIFKDFSLLSNIKFDVVVSTFVLQHIGYMPPNDIMNVYDIATEIKKFTKRGTVWILLEHDSENDWINKFFTDMNIKPDVYIRGFKGIELMTHRDHCTKDGHHLIIWKQ
ncbi:MAG TPA: class I SAM-dependent methyltransferase [Thermotogota bacterium]|nr:class I SAM-dependent methyltransferase [Thermotogota bacterium]